MKKILVVYYTQTGQLEKAIRSTLAPLENNAEITYAHIRPKKSYPYPWSYMEFFDIFPETVHGIPAELEPLPFNPDEHYDLVVIGYQPWFLSVCVPVNSFLQTPEAKRLLKGKPVVTILACRNMWLNGQEKMKKQLLGLEAKLVGNITYVDKAANLVSLVTVLAFVLAGKKEKFMGIFPKYGVSDKDLLEQAPTFGESIKSHLNTGNYETLQAELVSKGAVNIKRSLMLMEGRGKMLFPIYADYISRKGTAGSADRRTRVRIFGIVLPTAILILSPIITIVSRLAPVLAPAKMKREVDYYSQNTLR
ncbi:MAG: dialkylresorcinol condensing enzyme DarA [Bacteroidia bacterium]